MTTATSALPYYSPVAPSTSVISRAHMRPSLARRVEHERIIRKVVVYGGRYHQVANLRIPEDLDDRLCRWLEEAYLSSPT